MMVPHCSILAAGLLWASAAIAGYNPSSSNNLAIYWGQNSAGISNAAAAQKSLAQYCSNTKINIIPISFLSSIDPPKVDLANIGTTNVGNDITACQKAGKTILLSIGGATVTTGLSTAARAVTVADQIWAMFGPKGNSTTRPFGDAVIDGFDLDIEHSIANLAPFAARLRANMDKATTSSGRKFYLSAAPQCPFPDQNNKIILSGTSAVAFDFVMVQFYNNAQCDLRSYTGVTGQGFNMNTWDQWARTSKNPNVKIFLGVPGGKTAVSTSQVASYKTSTQLAPIIAFSKKFASFGGVMVWDMSQVYANTGFLDGVSAALSASKKRSEDTEARSHQRDWILY
ncbi:glycoside hydrolase family 18 protein [Whalleya microplaca]|nr:glycoside hydrolase family 18 protein [Whalleya microplaca]